MTKASPVPPVQREGTGAGRSPDALVSIRSDTLRFAALQLGNREAAEDVVQKAIRAALRRLQGFTGQSSLKTWVFAVFKNKMVDHARPSRRTVNSPSVTNYADQDGELDVDALFDERGGWRNGLRPVAWPSPDDAVQSRQFWIVFETCLDLLAPRAGKIFMMREFHGFESEEICLQLDLTTSNLHVMLHRSRLKLRGCLENGWVDPGAGVQWMQPLPPTDADDAQCHAALCKRRSGLDLRRPRRRPVRHVVPRLLSRRTTLAQGGSLAPGRAEGIQRIDAGGPTGLLGPHASGALWVLDQGKASVSEPGLRGWQERTSAALSVAVVNV